jgi:hypothetical protein
MSAGVVMLNQKIGFAKVVEIVQQLLDNDQITVADHKRLTDIQSRLTTNVSQITFADVEIAKMLAEKHLMPTRRTL